MQRRKYPRFLINMVKAVAYKVYKLGEKATTPPLDRYDFQTFDLLKRVLPSDANCIDVGAHTADILRKLVKYAPGGRHYAFEPIPWLYKDLQKNFGSKVTVMELALSDTRGEATFHAFPDRPAVSGLKQRQFPGEDYAMVKFDVKLETLDHIIPEDLPIHLIKIDVEGAELQVLRGGIRILKKYKPFVLFEFGLGGSELYGTTPEQMFEFLEACGLSVSTLEYYMKGKAPFDKAEFVGQYEKKYNYFFIAYNAAEVKG